MGKTLVFLIFCLNLFAGNQGVDGSRIYTKHGCYGCHGANAQGGNGFPKLAGKSITYLTKKLKGYRDGTIHSNRANMKRSFAKDLSNKEIEALATYLKSLGHRAKRSDEERYYEEFSIGDSSGS